MYQRTAKSSHYLPRTGSYSTVPKRNGLVEVLPPGASLETFDDFKEQCQRIVDRIEDLKREKDLVGAELNAENKRKSAYFHANKRLLLHRSKGIMETLTRRKNSIQETLNELNSSLSNLRRACKEKGVGEKPRIDWTLRFESEFVNMSRAMLPPDVFEKIFDATKELCGPQPERKKLPFHGQTNQ